MTWMLRLYPRAWQQRYGEEIATLIASEPRRFRLFLDLTAGAIDARMNPQPLPAGSLAGGQKSMTSTLRSCVIAEFTQEDRNRSSMLMIGSSLGFVALSLVLKFAFELTMLSQVILYSAYPMALILSGRSTYLKNYSRTARVIIMIASLAAMFGFFLVVTLIADRF